MNDRITTQCPACNAKLAVSSQHAGKKLKCPKCHAGVIVPLPSSTKTDNVSHNNRPLPAEQAIPPILPETSPAKTSERSNPRRVFGIALLLAVVATVTVCGMVLHDRSVIQNSERKSREYASKRTMKQIEDNYRKRWRDNHHKNVLENINNDGTLADFDRLEEEKKEQEKEWKEEDFRRELLEATRER
jgi:DNA-directed RNA polymerase subunit M/transcription elongation factor TFIIS